MSKVAELGFELGRLAQYVKLLTTIQMHAVPWAKKAIYVVYISKIIEPTHQKKYELNFQKNRRYLIYIYVSYALIMCNDMYHIQGPAEVNGPDLSYDFITKS